MIKDTNTRLLVSDYILTFLVDGDHPRELIFLCVLSTHDFGQVFWINRTTIWRFRQQVKVLVLCQICGMCIV